jgi:hypothetical protein
METRTSWKMPLIVCALLVFGCQSSEPASSSNRQALVPAPSPVTVAHSGSWQDLVRCTTACFYSHNFWVDLRVTADPTLEAVGIEWSSDEWATSKTVNARYRGSLGGEFEAWGVDVALGVAEQHPPEIQVRAFVRRAGVVTQEPRLHYIYNPVSEQRPVRLLWSKIEFDPATGVRLVGRARAFNFDPALNREVGVRYTTDGWATAQEVVAQHVQGDDWVFEIPDLGSTALPEEVAFALRYHLPGEEFWDNNGSNNFHHRIAPRFTTRFDVPEEQQPVTALSGILRVEGEFSSDLPVATLEVRLDDEPWIEGASLTFSTANLAQGEHRITFRANFVGGYSTTTEVPFGVDNHLVPERSWELSGAPLDVAVDSLGRFHVLFSGGLIAQYPELGAAAPTRTFFSSHTAWKIALDALGRIYVLDLHGARVTRHLSSGAIDRGYGALGTVQGADAANGGFGCGSRDLALVGQMLYLPDACGPRVSRFDESGQFAGVIELPQELGAAQTLAASGDGVWVITRQLGVRVENRGGQPAAVGALLPVESFHLGFQLSAMERGGELWTVDDAGRLTGFTPAGQLIGSWRGGTQEPPLLGALPAAKRVVGLPGGALAVLAGSALIRFQPATR